MIADTQCIPAVFELVNRRKAPETFLSNYGLD